MLGLLLDKTSSQATFEIPMNIVVALQLSPSRFRDYVVDGFDALWSLSRAKYEGLLNAIPDLARRADEALNPVDREALIDRLTLLGMAMTRAASVEHVKAWLHETSRLLSNLPACVLFPAIDACVMEPGRVFLPMPGEILAKAQEPLQDLRCQAARLRILAGLISERVHVPEWRPPLGSQDQVSNR